MATSRLQFAQDQVKFACDQCDISESVNSYCRDCSANLCESCVKAHLRLLRKHAIVSVFDGLFEKIHFKVNCEQHNERFKFFCKSCGENVCEECSTTEHTGHILEKVDKHAKILKQNITEKVQSKKTEVKKIQAPLSIINKHIENFEKHTQSQIDNVRSEIVRKKELLDTEGETIIESLKHEHKIALETLKTQYSKLKDLNDKLNALIESMEGKLTSIPDEAVLNFVIENEKELQTNTSNITFDLPSPSVFTPSSYMYDERSGVLGSLDRVRPTNLNIIFDPHPDILLGATQSTPTDPPSGVSMSQIVKPKVIVDPSLRRELKIINRFNPTGRTGGAVLSISATDGDTWVGTLDWKLVLVSKTGKRKLKVNMPDEPCLTAVTRAGDALVSTLGHVIYKVTRKGQVSTFVDVSPGRVYSITATQDGDVFALVDTDTGFKVKKFSSEGKFVLELDSAMFTPGNRLDYVHAVRDDVICIQDGVPDNNAECQLVFVTAAGQPVSRVTRTGKLREYTRAIVWDNHGNMLTGEYSGEYMHVFSGEGACKHSYKVEGGSGGIETLCLCKDGAVWLGTSRGEVIKARYLQ